MIQESIYKELPKLKKVLEYYEERLKNSEEHPAISGLCSMLSAAGCFETKFLLQHELDKRNIVWLGPLSRTYKYFLLKITKEQVCRPRIVFLRTLIAELEKHK